MRRASWALSVLACVSCAPTATVTLEVATAPGESPPSALTVSVFDQRHALAAPRVLDMPMLPGRIVLSSVPVVPLRVAIAGDNGANGWTRVVPETGKTVSVDVTLTVTSADRDGDAVPDAVDNCPDAANVDQLDADGDGNGDGCGGGGNASRCPVTAAFCDGFESGIDPGTWQGPKSNMLAKITVDNSRAYRGAQSMHIHVDPFTNPPTAYEQLDTNETQTNFVDAWTRVFVYVPAASEGLGSTLLKTSQNAAPYQALELGITNAGRFYLSDLASSPGMYFESATAVPTDRWFCLEWNVTSAVAGDMGGGASHLFVDGPEVGDLAMTMGLAAYPPFLGLTLSGDLNGPPSRPNGVDVWFDEVLISGTRLGCDR